MELNALLESLAAQIGLPQLSLDNNGVCRLVFDAKLTLDLEPADNGATVYLYAVIGNAPLTAPGELFSSLLSANYFCRETGSAFFSYDTDSGDILLQQKFLLDGLTPPVFLAQFEQFVATAESWLARIDDVIAALPVSRAGNPAQASDPMSMMSSPNFLRG